MATSFVFPRRVWGARKPRYVYKLDNPVPRLWIHHSVGAAPTVKSGERETMRAIQNFHMDGQGWSDIAYSTVVFPSGRAYNGRGPRRVGGHTAGDNSSSVAICFAGNFETAQPTDKAIAKAIAVGKRWRRRGFVTKDVAVDGHQNAPGAATACPGRNLMAKVAKIRRGIKRR